MSVYGQHVLAQTLYDSVATNALHNILKLKVSDYTGLELEKKISHKAIINIFAGMVIAMAADGFSVSQTPFSTRLNILPGSYIEYRNYYNLYKMIKEKKV